jgi:hypothetical protein
MADLFYSVRRRSLNESLFLIKGLLKRKSESASELFSKTIFSVLNLKGHSQATVLIVTKKWHNSGSAAPTYWAKGKSKFAVSAIAACTFRGLLSQMVRDKESLDIHSQYMHHCKYSIEPADRSSHRKKRFTSFPSPAGMSLTKIPLSRNNSVMTSLFPPRESLVVTSRLGTGNSRTFFYGARYNLLRCQRDYLDSMVNIITPYSSVSKCQIYCPPLHLWLASIYVMKEVRITVGFNQTDW